MMQRSLALVMMLSAGTAQAETAWEMFMARCLEPYENQALAIHDGLDKAPAEQMRDGETIFGPSDNGFLLVLNAEPEEGDRSCSVHNPASKEADAAYLSWLENAMSREVYVPVEGMLSSNEWIEPQLQFEATFDDAGAVYLIIETELES